MRVSLELPDPPRLEPLLESLSHQYQEVMQRLLQLHAEAQREDRYAPLLQAMQVQQDSLVSAFERMMQVMAQGHQQGQQRMEHLIRQEVATPNQEASEALVSAIRGMKHSLSSLPDDLDSVMQRHFKQRQSALMKEAPAPKAAPSLTASRVVQKLDQMEAALLQGLQRSRNRTFGSNY